MQTLHQKLDVTNASRIDLDIDAFIRLLERCTVLAPPLHFFPSYQRRFYRGKVHLFRINMGLDGADEFARQAGLSGRMSHFDECLLLPVMRG